METVHSWKVPFLFTSLKGYRIPKILSRQPNGSGFESITSYFQLNGVVTLQAGCMFSYLQAKWAKFSAGSWRSFSSPTIHIYPCTEMIPATTQPVKAVEN